MWDSCGWDPTQPIMPVVDSLTEVHAQHNQHNQQNKQNDTQGHVTLSEFLKIYSVPNIRPTCS
jgi:hypothetical protein